MTKNIVATESTKTTELGRMELQRDIKRIARAVIKCRITTEAALTEECLETALEHYIEIGEVYRMAWNKVKADDTLHPTHPAGKSEAYHVLKERGER